MKNKLMILEAFLSKQALGLRRKEKREEFTMTKMEIIVNLVAQEIPRAIGIWLGMFFITGFVIGLTIACIAEVMWKRGKKNIEKKAEEAGVTLHIETSFGIDPQAIEGCGACIAFIIIIAAAVMGISLPIVLTEAVEDLILVLVMVIFGAATWGLAFWSVYFVITSRRNFRDKLQRAIEIKSGSDS